MDLTALMDSTTLGYDEHREALGRDVGLDLAPLDLPSYRAKAEEWREETLIRGAWPSMPPLRRLATPTTRGPLDGLPGGLLRQRDDFGE